MRKSLLILALCSLPIFVWSQKYQETENGIKTSINEKKIDVEVQWFTPNSLRILKTPLGKTVEKKSLSVIAKPNKSGVKIATSDNSKIVMKSPVLTVTLNTENGIMTLKKNSPMGASEIAAAASINSDNGIGLLCVDDDCCSSNDMSSAINIPFINWQSGYISCPGNEVWYKFTANASGVHPNGSPGWYTIHTQGNLDTVGYLYDSYGHQIAYNDDGDNGLNFNIWAQLDYYETYYIRVKAYGGNTGSYKIRVSYFSDDHGNTPDTATIVTGVYYEDKSVSGCLHSQDDVDYYTFVPARNCVMEIYTEGDTDTYGRLYCASGGLLYSDNNSNGNGNFKITAHLEAMKRYYIAVSHNSSTGYGDYTLRFKFVRDWMNAVSGQYNIALWKNTDTPNATSTDYVEISRAFVTADAASEYYAVIVEDLPSHKPSIGAAIESGVHNELWSALRDSILDLLSKRQISQYIDAREIMKVAEHNGKFCNIPKHGRK